MSNVRHIANDSEFSTELNNAGIKLVVTDYFATWCGPCRVIAPAFAELSTKYPKAVFLKVDVDQCQDTAQREGVTAMPTFIFYRNKVKVDTMRGADASLLEEKIKKWYTEDEGEEGDSPIKGHMDLSSFINKSSSECLNESDDHKLEHCLSNKKAYLESDCDEQLIINIGFNQAVKLHSLKVHCAEENGPKNVKLFINQPTTLDFDSADSMESIQMLELKPDDLREGAIIPLKYVKLQNVLSLTSQWPSGYVTGFVTTAIKKTKKEFFATPLHHKLFVKDNQNGADTTRIDYLGFIGSPTNTTNMAEFKRIAGKKGESH